MKYLPYDFGMFLKCRSKVSLLKRSIFLSLDFMSMHRAPTTFKLEGEVTSFSESSQGEVGKLL